MGAQCPPGLSVTACKVLVQAEVAVSYVCAAVILAVAVPIMLFFVVDLTTYALKNVVVRIQQRRVGSDDFRFTPTSLIRRYFAVVSASLRESGARVRRLGKDE